MLNSEVRCLRLDDTVELLVVAFVLADLFFKDVFFFGAFFLGILVAAFLAAFRFFAATFLGMMRFFLLFFLVIREVYHRQIGVNKTDHR